VVKEVKLKDGKNVKYSHVIGEMPNGKSI